MPDNDHIPEQPSSAATQADPPAADIASESAANVPEPEATAEGDEQHRMFKEALARKNAKNKAMRDPTARNTGVKGARNDHTHREFRRKSG